jgi:hypothetical protein
MKSEKLQFSPPKELTWHYLTRSYVKLPKKLGYANEWEIYSDNNDPSGRNVFYRNVMTKSCVWDRPIDAVEISPAEKLCSSYQVSHP